jgi:caffeoyl-CoA O-methyltransferase
MSKSIIRLDDALYDYLLDISLREPEVLRRLRVQTAEMTNSNMQIAPDQGQFMALLVRLMGAKRVIEVGTFTGYSALSVALALPEDGSLIACDVSEEWTAVGRPYWEEAGVAERIDLRIAPATESLDALIAQGEVGRFDFAFIDADKTNYDGYYERLLTLLRPGGLIAVDNVLWSGDVIDPIKTDPDTEALRALNAKLVKDERVDISTLAIGDGLTLARKR